MKKEISPKSKNISEWYNDVVLKAGLADYAPVKGCMIIRPYGYSLWESVQRFLDPLFKNKEVENAYFPIFIPESYLKKEEDHVEGFNPYTAIVTVAGGQELKERLIVRPTSETIIYAMYQKWIKSWRDLPIKINQWSNVVRWEKRTYLFLRTSEFLWQEGHCAHAFHEESIEVVRWALDCYQIMYRDLMAMHSIPGRKSDAEKFDGADQTLTIEILMPDGKALQAGTSHDLGQNFAKAFNWTVQDEKGNDLYPWQNSWGLSTRSIGGLIMAHGDDNGLVLPPAIAPIQIVIIPVFNAQNKDYVLSYAHKIKEELSDFRAKLDMKEKETVGFKFNQWEMKGVPLRIEVGEKESKINSCTLVRRDNLEKILIPYLGIKKEVKKILKEIQDELLLKHRLFTEENTHTVDSYQ
jgi:prolyl-tRNA synthetase